MSSLVFVPEVPPPQKKKTSKKAPVWTIKHMVTRCVIGEESYLSLVDRLDKTIDVFVISMYNE